MATKQIEVNWHRYYGEEIKNKLLVKIVAIAAYLSSMQIQVTDYANICEGTESEGLNYLILDSPKGQVVTAIQLGKQEMKSVVIKIEDRRIIELKYYDAAWEVEVLDHDFRNSEFYFIIRKLTYALTNLMHPDLNFKLEHCVSKLKSTL